MIDKTVSNFVEVMTGKKLNPLMRQLLDNPPSVQDQIDAEVRRRQRMRELLTNSLMSCATIMETKHDNNPK